MPTIQELFTALLRDIAGAQRAADEYWRQSSPADGVAMARSAGPVIGEVEFEIKCAVARMDAIPIDPAEGFGPQAATMSRVAQRYAAHFANAVEQGLADHASPDRSSLAASSLRENLVSTEFADALAERILAALLELHQERAVEQRKVSAMDVIRRCRAVVTAEVMQQEAVTSETSASERKSMLDHAEKSAAPLAEQVVATFARLRRATNPAMELVIGAEQLGALPREAVSSVRIRMYVPVDPASSGQVHSGQTRGTA